MTIQSARNVLFLILCLVPLYGCALLGGVTAGQEWSDNYTQAAGVQANDPAIIDGNPETIGQSQYIASSEDTVQGLNAPSESIILLPESKSIHRIIIHSPNLEAFDIWTMDNQGKWGKFREIQNNKKEIIDLRLKQVLNTSGIKIRVRRTSDDAEMRRKNIQRVGGYKLYRGRTRATAKIGEIQLYGFVAKSDKENPPYPVD